MVIDGEIAFTGSQNLIEPVLQQPAAPQGGPRVGGADGLPARSDRHHPQRGLRDRLAQRNRRVPARNSSRTGREPHAGNITAQVVPSGPGFITENNLRLFNTLIYSAQHKISICSPYFVPDDSLLYAVTTAAQRGVDVELFVSEKGDQFLVHHAQQSYYEALLEAGVRIYLYKAPFVLHAKHFTIDDEVAVLGSSNMDMRSFSLNLEVSVMLLGEDIVQRIRAVEDTYREISHELVLDDWMKRPMLVKYVDNVARLTATLAVAGPALSRLGELRAECREDAEGLGPDLLVLLLRGGIRRDRTADAEAQLRRAVAGPALTTSVRIATARSVAPLSEK